MSEIKSYFKVKNPSEKNFGIVFSLIFFIISLYLYFVYDKIYYQLFALSIIFLLASVLFSKILIIPNKIWVKFGNILNRIISPIIMFIIYFFVITPIGLMMKILGKDLLNQKINIQKKSYWTLKNNSSSSIKDQF